MTARQQRIRFFAEHAGYSVPPGRMGCAKDLADAEEYAAENEWCFCWEPDFDGDLGDHDAWCGRKDCSHEVLSCVVRDLEGNVLASLGGIIDPDTAYSAVIEAELASEAWAEQESNRTDHLGL